MSASLDGSQDCSGDNLKHRSTPNPTKQQQLDEDISVKPKKRAVATLFLVKSIAMFLLPLIVVSLATRIVGPMLGMEDSATFGSIVATATTMVVLLWYIRAVFNEDAESSSIAADKKAS